MLIAGPVMGPVTHSTRFALLARSLLDDIVMDTLSSFGQPPISCRVGALIR